MHKLRYETNTPLESGRRTRRFTHSYPLDANPSNLKESWLNVRKATLGTHESGRISVTLEWVELA